jgi:hypothetical protein
MTDPSAVTGDVPPGTRRTGVLSLPMLIPLVVGLLVGAAATYSVTSSRGVPAVVQGTVRGIASDSPDKQVRAIEFRFDGVDYPTPGGGEDVVVVADVPWTDAAGNNYGGIRPVCLADGKYGQRVELAVLDVRGEGNWYSQSQLVVWVHCLS